MPRTSFFPSEYGTAPFRQASPLASPLDNGLDTGSATQRKPLPKDIEDDKAEDPAAVLMRLMKLGELLGGGE